MSQTASAVQTQRLELWRGKLNASGLPVFSRTIRDIRNVSSSSRSSARDLSDVVGNDASMAARVIQIANSPMFNLQNRHIDTISSAVVLVGFDAVRELAISVSVIEEMLKGRQHARVRQHMAQAFHAAAQARSFARVCGHKSEEVFVAALLKHVGDMAFWSRAEREAMAIEALVMRGTTLPDAEREVLGFELSQLGQSLAADWNLGELVSHVLDGRHEDDVMVKHVQMGHQLARLLTTHDLQSTEVDAVVNELTEHLNLKAADVRGLISANLDAAASIAKQFGLDQPLQTLNQDAQSSATDLTSLRTEPADMPGIRQSAGADVDAPTYNATLLLDELAELADSLEAGASRDVLMKRIVTGLHQALGFCHAYFALFTPDRTKLVVKYSAGMEAAKTQGWPAQDPYQDPVFVNALATFKAQTFSDVAKQDAWHFGGPGAVVAVKLAQKPVGMLYVENAIAEPVTPEQFAGFRQLGQQIALVLTQAA